MEMTHTSGLNRSQSSFNVSNAHAYLMSSVEASPEIMDMLATEDTHYIGNESPSAMMKVVSLKDIVKFNARQLKIIEMNNMKQTESGELKMLSGFGEAKERDTDAI